MFMNIISTYYLSYIYRKGLAMGCVVGGFGGGSLVFNYIQTAILNPDNVSPAASGPDEVRITF